MTTEHVREPLWRPSEKRIKNANMTRFIAFVNEKYLMTAGGNPPQPPHALLPGGVRGGASPPSPISSQIRSYDDLYTWSIENRDAFWGAMWEFGAIKASRPYETILVDSDDMIGAKWFEGARLNFAENLLRFRDERVALIFKGETQEPVEMTYAQLYDNVCRLATAMRDIGVTIGDRVAGFMPNMTETVIAMLAATSIGAIWSSCSPDFGIKGVLDRFGQIKPKMLFTANGYSYKGKAHDSLARIADIIKELPTIEKVVVVPYTEQNADISHVKNAEHYEDFIAKGHSAELEFEQLPFDHPLYIMYSSGTTGLPKCMIHGAGGTLIQHLKELSLHTDLKREDTIFYFTTCGWMMWNWLVSSLALGAAVLLFDGMPFYPEPGALFQLAQDERITIFGTSARYISALDKQGVKPARDYDLSPLRTMLSTGSVLSAESFEYVYRDIKKDVCLSSISGGTDIISCFALGNPLLPVYVGELQCRGLGMKVEAYDTDGRAVTNQKGELVCTASFPSMPVYFWNDPANKKYKNAYFECYPNIWRHGDYIEITETGGVIIYGRSDATLNPSGVRIGTAEIYRQVEALDEIVDSLVVGQSWENDERVLLFVKLAEGVELTAALVDKIKSTIRQNTSPRHVPAKIIAVADIPYTISGKKVELAVRNVIHNVPVLNKDALANPAALELYKNIRELRN